MSEEHTSSDTQPQDFHDHLLLQAFAWDLPADQSLWRTIAATAHDLADLGIEGVWLPPAYKGHKGAEDVGYGVYDMYDLGEFDQKGSIATKYGTKDEYLAAIDALHEAGIHVIADIVLNHRLGGDETEEVRARRVDPGNRMQVISDEETIRAWTRFTFPGRAGTYSDFQWNSQCFKGIDWDENTKTNAVWLFDGKEWDPTAGEELGNYDYLMGCDVDVSSPQVNEELDRWGRWYVETTGVDALRLDAVKHIGSDFFLRWLKDLRAATGKSLPVVGEYWSYDVGQLCSYLDRVPQIGLFDVPLHFHFHEASVSDGNFDLSQLYANTLVAARPQNAVTFVENHDTQPGQSLESTVAPWFKLSAYALILFRDSGVPCVFWGDLLGSGDMLPAVRELPFLMQARKTAAQGPQFDAFDNPDVVGFARQGIEGDPSTGCAVVLSDRLAGEKRLFLGKWRAGENWVCAVGEHPFVVIDEDGWATFPVSDGGLSVYFPEAAHL